MTIREKLRSGTDKDIEVLLEALVYRSRNYHSHKYQIKDWLDAECNLNSDGEVILSSGLVYHTVKKNKYRLHKNTYERKGNL